MSSTELLKNKTLNPKTLKPSVLPLKFAPRLGPRLTSIDRWIGGVSISARSAFTAAMAQTIPITPSNRPASITVS